MCVYGKRVVSRGQAPFGFGILRTYVRTYTRPSFSKFHFLLSPSSSKKQRSTLPEGESGEGKWQQTQICLDRVLCDGWPGQRPNQSPTKPILISVNEPTYLPDCEIHWSKITIIIPNKFAPEFASTSFIYYYLCQQLFLLEKQTNKNKLRRFLFLLTKQIKATGILYGLVSLCRWTQLVIWNQ